MVIRLTLMPDRQDGDSLGVINLKQGHIACCTKWDDEFPQEWPMSALCRFAAGEWEQFQQFPGLTEGLQGTLGHLDVVQQ